MQASFTHRDPNDNLGNAKARILFVEDDPKYRRLLMTNLRIDGYQAVAVADGQSALAACCQRDPDLVILDLRLPDIDGIDLIARVRELTTVPIFVVSAVHSEPLLVAAFDAGADDYLSKPYSVIELRARIRALVHRSQALGSWGPEISYGDIRLSTRTRECFLDRRKIRLTPLEWRLMRELVAHGGELLSHEYLLSRVWGMDYSDDREYLRVYIRNLRQRLEPDPKHPVYLISVPRLGYALTMPNDPKPGLASAESSKPS